MLETESITDGLRHLHFRGVYTCFFLAYTLNIYIYIIMDFQVPFPLQSIETIVDYSFLGANMKNDQINSREYSTNMA